MTTLFTRTSSTGATIEGLYRNGAIIVRIDGKDAAKGQPEEISKALRSKIPAQFVAVIADRKYTMPLLAEEVAAFGEAVAADANETMKSLRAERERLVLTAKGIADELDAARLADWDAADAVAPLASADLDAAYAAIKAFDAARPEAVPAKASVNPWM
jgi:hypothetical protein